MRGVDSVVVVGVTEVVAVEDVIISVLVIGVVKEHGTKAQHKTLIS